MSDASEVLSDHERAAVIMIWRLLRELIRFVSEEAVTVAQ